jgi:hypothetical protein
LVITYLYLQVFEFECSAYHLTSIWLMDLDSNYPLQ